MPPIRKSGGVVVYYYDGTLPAPTDAAFVQALANRRFRTIEHAASEEISVGWVTAADPTGDSFDLEDLDGGGGTWLRYRLDKKSLPKKWLQIHRDAAEKARGKKLSARERRELKDDLAEKLLPRVLPTVQLIDALLFHDRRTLFLFATSKSAREAFTKLFFESFALPLERANPLRCALQAGLGRDAEVALERLEPVRWPRGDDGVRATGRRAGSGAAAAAAREIDA
jgi:DNA recombination-dependent growth factor C